MPGEKHTHIVNKTTKGFVADKIISKTKDVEKVIDIELSSKRKNTLLAKTNTPAIEEQEFSFKTLYKTPPKEILSCFKNIAKERKIKEGTSRKTAKTKFLADPIKKGKSYTLDLRIHSSATEGFLFSKGVEQAHALIRLANAKRIDTIAITDYHSAKFIDIVKDAVAQSSKSTLRIIPGLDLHCSYGESQDFFLSAFFPEDYGTQEVDNVIRQLEVPQQCQGLARYVLLHSVDRVVEIIENNGGIIIPSNVDQTPNTQIAIPHLVDDLGFHAFNIISKDNYEFFKKRWPNGEFTFFSFSNAFSLAQIGSRVSKMRLNKPGFEGIKEIVKRRL